MKRPFYKDLRDTLDEVGISRRQISYWRDEGLFEPELGQDSRYFTERDMIQLRRIKLLVEELGLPVKTVLMLKGRSAATWTVGDGRDLSFSPQYISLEFKSFLTEEEAHESAVRACVNTGEEETIERWIEDLVLIYLLMIKGSSQSAKVYETRRSELFERLKRMDHVARAETAHDDLLNEISSDEETTVFEPRLHPQLTDDPEPLGDSWNTMLAMEDERKKRLSFLGENLVRWLEKYTFRGL